MGRGGYTIVEASNELDILADTNWFAPFSVDNVEDPDGVMIFLHLQFNLDTPAIVSAVINGFPFVLNEGVEFKGSGFRTFGFTKGQDFTVRASEDQGSDANFILAVES